MNERIRLLAEQCHHLYSEHNIDLDKFAQLIVQECAELIESQHTWITSVAASALIRKHFGVEE